MSGEGAALSFLLDNLTQIIVREISLFSNAKENLKQLQKHLESLKAHLADNAHSKSKGEAFKIWEKQVREVICDAEDAIDSAVIRATLKNFSVGEKRRHAEEVERIINEINKNFTDVKSEFDKLELRSLSEPDNRTTTASHRLRMREPLRDKTVVGFEDEITTLIKTLKEKKSGVEAISIIGMPGLGKTTVASKIFHHPDIEFEFTKRIWVNVSQEYEMRDIYTRILNQHMATNIDRSKTPEVDLFQKVRDCLKTVKFLLVVDDVWTVDAWLKIKAFLPSSDVSSRVLVTSRDAKVATSANPYRTPHRLRFLDRHETWKLLQLEVFDDEGKWPQHLQNIGRNIADRCKGLPLAVVVTGGILRDKMSLEDYMESEWKKVSEGVIIDEDRNVEGMKKIISLSYDAMRDNLRDCFLYLSVYPEDFEIPVWKLTRLWIAEGFIEERPGQDISLEEIAEDYVRQLIKTNLVMVGKKTVEGEVKTCHVHDVIRDFCKEKAEAKELNLVKEVKRLINQGTFHPEITEINTFRRLCIHSFVLEFIKKKPKAREVRSFICFASPEFDVPLESAPFLLEAFELLRVFEGSSIRFPKYLPGLTRLIHLRYITLTVGDDFKALPDALSDIWNLQTLLIKTSSPTFTIKADILSMRRLRHLKTKAAIVLEEKKASKLAFKKDKKSGEANEILQTLNRLSTQSCKVNVLSRTPNVKTLGIRGDLSSLVDDKCFANLGCLRKLKMIHNLGSGNPLLRFPDVSSFPPKLRSLTLHGVHFDETSMGTLGMLLNLEILKLKDTAFKGGLWNAAADGFFYLQYLHIERSNLKTWQISDGSFPTLRFLGLKNCMDICDIPICLAKSLQALDLATVSNEAVKSAIAIKEKKQENQDQSSGGINEFKLGIAAADFQRATGANQLP